MQCGKDLHRHQGAQPDFCVNRALTCTELSEYKHAHVSTVPFHIRQLPHLLRPLSFTSYMGEKEAEILDDCLSAIVEVGPLIALLENVYGLRTV